MVVMQTPDSVFVDGVTTDSLGCFVFHRTLKRYRLIFQHLLYKSVVKDYDVAGDMGVVTMGEQLANLLKSTPVGNVEKAEVMYRAPAKYRVRGAVINLVLKERKSEEPFLRGEVGAGFTQARYVQGSGSR